MIEVAEVCVSSLVGLVLVLRFLDRREMRKRASVASSLEGELREKMKLLDTRVSKIEMKAAIR